MATKLNTITTQYHSYTVDQVLTHYQLNETIDYFEDQDRLSRVFLLGTGIACGFKVSLSAVKDAITISQGNGITTDGDLIKLVKASDNEVEKIRTKQKLSKINFSNITYKSYTLFTDSDAKYPPFRNGDTLIPIFEILPMKADGSPDIKSNQFPLSSFPSIENFVVVLYLESYPKEAAKCSGIDCDNQGIEEVNNLRVLLIQKSDVDTYVNQNDTIWKEFNEDDADLNSLPEIRLKRVMLNKINSSSDLNKAYNRIIFSQSEELRKAFLRLISSSPKFRRSFIFSDINKFFSLFKEEKDDVQYRYDLLKDLIDTYAEIKELVNHTNVLCNPDINAFPKHLLLGLTKSSNEEKDLYRHSFYKSHILSDDVENSDRIQSLLLRFLYMLKEFDLRIQTDDVIITPSNLNVPLGKKAIPVYYNLPKQLIRYWDYDKSKVYKEKNNLSYHKSLLSDEDYIKNPLSYNLEPYNFFRIEDVHGKEYKRAFSEIDKLRLSNGLNFDIQCLSIDMKLDDIDLKEYDCQFKDLQMHLSSWKIEQECLYKEAIEFLSGFSTKDKGGHNYFDKLPKKVVDKTTRTSDSNISALATAFANKKVIESKGTSEIIEVSETKKIVFQDEYTPIENNTQSVQFIKGLVEFEGSILDNTDDLGSIMSEVFNIKYPLSESDYSSLLKAEAIKKIPDYEQWSKPDRELRLDTPLRIAASIKALSLYIPTTIDQINETLLSNYSTALNNLCNLVKKSFNTINSNLNKADGGYTKVGFEESYLNLISRLKENCCSADYLKILFEEVIDRKKNILNSLLFENYVEKHPGLEHLCGVPNGGTYILVFEGGKTKNSNLVVADFSLPYLCCSDCVPINFVLESVVMLNLKKNTVCFDVEKLENSDVYFEVIPPDGEITVVNSPAGIVIKGGKISFTEEFNSFNNPLEFLVNGKSVSTKLIVTLKPTLDIIFSFDKETNTVTLESSIESTNNNYTWDVNGKSVGKTKKVSFVQTESETLTITLTLDSGLCGELTTSKTKDIEITLNLDIFPEYCFDPKKDETTTIPFNVRPSNAIVTLAKEIPGIDVIEKNLILQPDFDYFDEPIYFLINGKESTSTITINKKPELTIDTDFNTTKKRLFIGTKVESEDGNYTWTVNGKTKTTTDQSFEIEVTKSGTFDISLSIKKGICGPLTTEKSVTINIEVGLTIEPKHCFNNEPLLIPFTVIPNDASLTLSKIIDGVSITNDNVIIGKKFSLFNTPIAFKVNNEDVTQTITIQRRPNVTTIDSNYNASSSTLNLTTTSENPDNKYEWFVDDVSIGQGKTVSVQIDLSPGTHSIKLIIDTGICGLISSAKEIIVEKVIEDNPPSFKLDTNEICFNKTVTAISFNASPADASVGLKENYPGVSIKDNKVIFGAKYTSFNKPKEIIFVVNGVEFAEKITVFNNSLADIIEKFNLVDGKIKLTSSLNSNNNQYNWSIDNKENDNKEKTIDIDLPENSLTNSNKLIDILLQFEGKCGKAAVSKKMPVCFLFSESYLKKEEERLQELMVKNDFIKENYGTNKGFTTIVEFFQNYNQNVSVYLEGARNGDLNFVIEFLNVVRNHIVEIDDTDLRSILIELYKIVLRFVFNIIRCQDEDKILQFLDLFKKRMESHFNSFNQNNIAMGSESFLVFLEEYLVERENQPMLNSIVKIILDFIKQ